MRMNPSCDKSFQNAVTDNSLLVKGWFSYSNSWSICYPKHVGVSSKKLLCIMWKNILILFKTYIL